MARGGNGDRHRKGCVRRIEPGPAARLGTYDNSPSRSLVGLFKDQVTVFRPTHHPTRRSYHGCVGLFNYQWPCFKACDVRTGKGSRLSNSPASDQNRLFEAPACELLVRSPVAPFSSVEAEESPPDRNTLNRPRVRSESPRRILPRLPFLRRPDFHLFVAANDVSKYDMVQIHANGSDIVAPVIGKQQPESASVIDTNSFLTTSIRIGS
jgi:hypothetical protein